MTFDQFFGLFHQYGLILIAVVVFCEYMNLPGFPAGVIMPGIGVLVSQSELSLFGTVLLSIAAGVLGSLVIYSICYFGGQPILHRLIGKSEKAQKLVDKCHSYIEVQHARGLVLTRLIPVLRTIVSIPAGLLRIPVKWFIGWSAVGIAVWNTALISFGYFFSDKIFGMLA